MTTRRGATRVVLVGAGRWGRRILDVLLELPEVEVVGVVDRDAQRLRDLTEIEGLVRGAAPPCFVGDLGEALARCGEVHAVLIAALPRHHAELAAQALAAGADVFVEKPMALSAAHALELADRAARAGRALMVGHLLHHHPAVERLYALVEAGVLGEIERTVAARLAPQTRGEVGAWWALAPHDLGIARRIFGSDPAEVIARCTDSRLDEVAAHLEHAGGRQGVLEVSGRSPRRVRRSVVVGSRRVAFLDELGAVEALRVADRARFEAGMRSREQPRLSGPCAPGLPVAWLDGAFASEACLEARCEEVPPGAPLTREIESFVAVVRGGQCPVADAVEGLAVVRTLATGQASALASLRAHRDARRVPVGGSRVAEGVGEDERGLAAE